MVNKNNIFEDLARISTSVATIAFESAKNIQEGIKGTTKGFAASADLVSREEFEALKAMVSKARLDTEPMVKEFAELKKQVQTFNTALDVLKDKVAKAPAAVQSNPDEAKKLFDEMEKVKASLEERMKNFEGRLGAQSAKIDELSKPVNINAKPVRKVEKPASEKPVLAEKPADVIPLKPAEIKQEAKQEVRQPEVKAEVKTEKAGSHAVEAPSLSLFDTLENKN